MGHPLCAQCYDYSGHVVWNFHAGKLWSRTVDRLRRYTTHAGAKLRYAKVAEFQRRGTVHFHAIIRLDSYSKDTIVAPPPQLGVSFLSELLTEAAATTNLTTPAHPDRHHGWDIRWGEQVDIQPLCQGLGDDQLTDKYVRYLAKYATKSTEPVGLNARRLNKETVYQFLTPTHVGRLITACWRLGRPIHPGFFEKFGDKRSGRRWVCQNNHPPRRTRLRHCAACGSSNDADSPKPATELGPYQRLRRWAHVVGYGGHFLTKSQRYSTTFTALRNARRLHHAPVLSG
ncbi:MAG: replication initiator, partial [Mycobacteriales bacterium]